jgi:pimeloyl-ACP methyl ester carboxylesterase
VARFCCSLLAVATIPFALTAQLPAQPKATMTSEPTTVRSYDGRSTQGLLLQIKVPERRAHAERVITLSALKLSSTAAQPGPPIVFLMGGPGIPGSAMASIPPYYTLFERLREIADVVIVDQRGIGRSEPVLDCQFKEAMPLDSFIKPEQIVASFRREARSCAQQWRAQGVEPTAYNSIESADDLDDLRRGTRSRKDRPSWFQLRQQTGPGIRSTT